MYFDVMLLDTIPPVMQLDTTWIGYTNEEVMGMYKNFYTWVQVQGDKFNRDVAGTVRTLELPDTTITYVEDSMKYFSNTIPILEYRVADGYWWEPGSDLTALFQ